MQAAGMCAVLYALACTGLGASQDTENQAALDPTLQFLKEITLAPGPPGDEDAVRAILRRKLAGIAPLSVDSRGALLARKPGTAEHPLILLSAHMDEVAFQVRSITPDGYLRLVPLGLWYPPVTLAHRARVRTARGSVLGIFGSIPAHLISAEQKTSAVGISDLFLDVGARDVAQARDMGIEIGDHVVPDATFERMANPNRLVSKACDDRVGCALIAEVLRGLANESHPNTVVAAWTPLEETGRLNATVEAPGLVPDLVIVVEVGITADLPGVAPEAVEERLGLGPSLDLYDGLLLTAPAWRRWVTRIATESGIPLQQSTIWVEGSGHTTHGTSFLFRAPSLAVLVPMRYAHTSNEIIDYTDYVHARDLLLKLVTSLDRQQLETIIGQN